MKLGRIGEIGQVAEKGGHKGLRLTCFERVTGRYDLPCAGTSSRSAWMTESRSQSVSSSGADGQPHVQRVVHGEGRTFTSIREAARQLGIADVTYRNRVRRAVPGYFIEEIEVDQPVHLARKDGRPVIFHGVYYPSIIAAAKGTQVDVATVRRKIGQGVQGCYFEDEGQRSVTRRDIRRPVIINGISYESAACAARELGIPRATIATRLRRSTFPNYFYQK